MTISSNMFNQRLWKAATRHDLSVGEIASLCHVDSAVVWDWFVGDTPPPVQDRAAMLAAVESYHRHTHFGENMVPAPGMRCKQVGGTRRSGTILTHIYSGYVDVTWDSGITENMVHVRDIRPVQ